MQVADGLASRACELHVVESDGRMKPLVGKSVERHESGFRRSSVANMKRNEIGKRGIVGTYVRSSFASFNFEQEYAEGGAVCFFSPSRNKAHRGSRKKVSPKIKKEFNLIMDSIKMQENVGR